MTEKKQINQEMHLLISNIDIISVQEHEFLELLGFRDYAENLYKNIDTSTETYDDL